MVFLTKPCQSMLSSSKRDFFHQNVFKQEFHGSNVWRMLRSRQTKPYANSTERWLMDKELSFMQTFLRSVWKQRTVVWNIYWKENHYSLEINFKRLCIKILVFVLWIMTNAQCLHVPSYILQCNSYSLPLITTLKKKIWCLR